MGEPLPRSGTPGTTFDGESTDLRDPGSKRTPLYQPYRPPGGEFTPPASPQPLNPYAAPSSRKGFGSSRPKHPEDLHMDTNVAPAYERPTYSPTPSSSPPLPPLPSPHYPPRQRAPSLLRHTAASSPLNDGFPRAEQFTGSPTFTPSTLRQGSGHGPTSDPRTFFNPLASNPVEQSGPLWGTSQEDVGSNNLTRPRGLTSSSQQDFNPHPPLRSTTSIPDYGPYRGSDRPNLSGAYRPNRGGANWSHNEYYPPPRHFRGEEMRASFRSAWTNGSSSFVDASGTERSSMATGRSSTASDIRLSIASRDHSEELDALPTTSQEPEPPVEEYDGISAVEDVIDAYCYGDDEDVHGEGYVRTSEIDSSQVDASDCEAPDLSRSYSHGGSSHLTSEPNATPSSPEQAGRPISYNDDREPIGPSDIFTAAGPYDRMEEDPQSESFVPYPGFYNNADAREMQKRQQDYLPTLQQLSPLQLEYAPTQIRPLDNGTAGNWPPRGDSVLSSPERHKAASPVLERKEFRNIHKELKDLPQLPKNKARISRQDWDNFQAYSKKNAHSRDNSYEVSAQKRPALAVHIPPVKQSDPLPEVDEDQAFPRRASTSVFDRKSTLLEFTRALHSPPPQQLKKSNTLELSPSPQGIERQNTGLTSDSVSPLDASPSSPLPNLQMRVTPKSFPRDHYGFKKATDKISVQEYDAWYGSYERYVSRRRGKWTALMDKQGLQTADPTQFPEKCEKVKRYTRKGFPPEWRGAMWWFYGGGPEKLASMQGLYASLAARVKAGELNKDDREAIERDLDRTFPDNIHFRPDPTSENPDGKSAAEPEIFQNLREVLQCFALNNPNIGYCQSLNFIAGLLLLFMKQDVERVFVLLTIITQSHLPGAHARNLANTEVNVLMMLIKEYLPKVWNSINDTDLINNGAGSQAHPDSKFQRQPTVALSCTGWFMSLFVGVLPIEVVLRVWDAFLYEGPRALFRYALAIFKLGEPEIKRFQPGDGELFMTVQNLPRKCLDPNVLHDIAYVKKGFGSLSQNVIDQKRLFWTQQLAREKSGRNAPRPGQQTRKGTLLLQKDLPDQPEDKKSGVGGLRRKASRRFFKKDR